MWFLSRSTNPGVILYGLLPGREYTVGRKDCHILLSMDQSISRSHAKLTVSGPAITAGATPTAAPPTVTLKDLSKFGTRVNGCKVERSGSGLAVVELKNGEEVKFGGTPTSTVFRIHWTPVVVCCSGMMQSEQTQVKQQVQALGGRVVPQWTKECLCLVMTKLTVTQKVICALSCCKPIVTAGWLEALVKSCEQQKQLPDPASHLPPITDQNVERDPSIFYPDPSRHAVFKDKVLCFLSKQQCTNYELCVTMCGGVCKFIEPQSVRPASLNLSPSCMVVSVEESGTRRMRGEDKAWMEEVFQRVQEEGFRKIHETEMVRAVLYRSTVEYCNPTSQPVPVGDPLALPTLSQMSCLGTQHSQLPTSDTQLHSQASLLAERREANTSCSLHSEMQPVKEEPEENKFRVPPPPPATSLSVLQADDSSTDGPAQQSLDLSSCGGDESLERRGSVLAPSSVPADSSLDEGKRPASASFVVGLFPQQKKGKRSFGEVDGSPDSVNASTAKKSVCLDQSVCDNSQAHDSGSLRTDKPNFCNVFEHERSPSKQLPSGDIDVFGFRKRKSSQSPQDGRQKETKRKLLKTLNSDDTSVTNAGTTVGGLSQNDASIERLSVPANSHIARNTTTAARRPKRFAAPPPRLSPQQFISTRKSSAAFHHPPLMTDGNTSRILNCSYREILKDVTASQLASGSYNEEDSDGEGEDEDGSLPVLECPLLPLVKRQKEIEEKPHLGKEGHPLGVRNYKTFRKCENLCVNCEGYTSSLARRLSKCMQRYPDFQSFLWVMQAGILYFSSLPLTSCGCVIDEVTKSNMSICCRLNVAPAPSIVVQCSQSGQLPGSSKPINLEVYRKPEDTSLLAGLQGCFGESDHEEQEGSSEEENPFVFQTKRK